MFTWQAFDQLIRALVGDEHVLHDGAGQLRRKEAARRERAEEVAAECVHPWLVERAPVPDAGSK